MQSLWQLQVTSKQNKQNRKAIVESFKTKIMKIKHDKTLISPETSFSISKIDQCSWSSNGNRLAVCTSNNNQVTLFSGVNLDKKEKFALKAVDKAFSKETFTVKGLAFSPDSTRIAIGQTDCVIYVFKVGLEVGDKKVISGKFTIPSPCTALVWHDSGIIFGSLDGKVKIIQNSNNKMGSVISSNSMVVSLSVSGDELAVGFLAGAIVLTTIGSKGSSKQVATSTSPPFAMSLTCKGFLCFGGSDGKVSFIDLKGNSLTDSKQVLELGTEVNTVSCSPAGNLIIVGSLESLVLFKFENYWRKFQALELSGGHLITSTNWTRDGTRMVVATLNGGLELFSFEWKRKMISDKFQVDFVGGNQITVTDVSSGKKSVFKSIHEIEDVKVIKGHFAVVKTSSTLILGDTLVPGKVSEVEWGSSSLKGAKFCFDYEGVVLINFIGELHVVELGQNEYLCSVRTDFVNSNLMSVRVNQRKSGIKFLAYLLDLRTACILDLTTNVQQCVWNHEEKLQWIELNETGKKMLFRDKLQRLYLLDIVSQESQMILNVCSFVEWVPGSDVIVAQSNEKMYVWYDLLKPVTHEIPGRIEASGIERKNGSTRVIFSNNKYDLTLDEALLEFDTALEDGDLERAVSFLESVRHLTAESESMWRHLAKVALKNNNLLVAERSFAAVGDVTRATFIRECEGDLYQLALLDKDWSTFETNDFDEAIETYIRLHKWQRAIDLAARTGRGDVQQDLEQRYFKYLMDSGQQAEAGAVMERSGDLLEAIKLYEASGRPVQAAKVILEATKSQKGSSISESLIKTIIQDLKASEFWSEAGTLYEMTMRDPTSALESYVTGKDFVKAIDLARKEFPEEVVSLEGKYGEHLLTEIKDASSAVGHLIEAGKTERALEAAIIAGQFDRASEISMVLERIPAHFARQIAEYYASKNDIDSAIEMFMNSNQSREAINLLNNKSQYSRALKLARKVMSEDEVAELFGNLASSFKQEGKVKEAEKVYLTIRDTDSAISMYKQLEQYDQMIRLVQQYHPDLLQSTHLHLANKLQSKASFKEAEVHYISGGDWNKAIDMYKAIDRWEDAYRVARSHAGPGASREVAYGWASHVSSTCSPEEAVKLLTRIGLLHQVIDVAIDSNAFNFAICLVSAAGPEVKFKENEIKFKNAIFYEEEARFSDAEILFLESGKIKEAVRMYVKAKSFPDALRLTEKYIQDESVMSDVLVAQTKYITEVEGKTPESLARVETLLLRAGRMDLMVRMYRDQRMWEDAFRVAEQHVPNLLDSLKRDLALNSRGSEVSLMDGIMTPSLRRGSRAAFSRKSSVMSINTMEDMDSLTGIEDARDLRQNLERVEKSGDRDRAAKYSFALATQLAKEKDPVEALKVLANHPGVYLLPDITSLMELITCDILSFDYEPNPGLSVFRTLRDSWLSIISNTQSEDARLLLISHYLVLKLVLSNLTSQHHMSSDLLVKICTSLLRYTDVLRVDKAFYEAGQQAKEVNKNDLTFIFWNHFLDLTEAIEEKDPDVDHSNFEKTDIPVLSVLPGQPYFKDPSVVDEVKSWILHISMDSDATNYTLPLCAYREGDVFEASLSWADGSTSLPCLVTGYPVIRHKMMELKTGKYAANKDDWNKLLMLTKTSGSEDLKEVVSFVGRLCGNESVAKFSFQ